MHTSCVQVMTCDDPKFWSQTMAPSVASCASRSRDINWRVTCLRQQDSIFGGQIKFGQVTWRNQSQTRSQEGENC